MLNNKLRSPIRFTDTAFIADLQAKILEDQKPTKKYEQSPTPSHPKKKQLN